jgi:hypothetical protein
MQAEKDPTSTLGTDFAELDAAGKRDENMKTNKMDRPEMTKYFQDQQADLETIYV